MYMEDVGMWKWSKPQPAKQNENVHYFCSLLLRANIRNNPSILFLHRPMDKVVFSISEGKIVPTTQSHILHVIHIIEQETKLPFIGPLP